MHPDVLSLSEFFTVLGRESSLERGKYDGQGFWQYCSAPLDGAAARLLQSPVDIPEILYRPDPGDSPRDRVAPLLLVPLPHLSGEPRALLDELRAVVSDFPLRSIEVQYSHLFSWLSDRFQRRIWVERSGGSLAYVDRLIKAWPSARFVHIIRSGPECALSMSRHPFFSAIVNTLVARRTQQIETEESSGASLQDFGLYWSAQLMRGAAVLRALPTDRVLNVGYESLTADPEMQIGRIMHFLLPDSDVDRDWLKSAAAIVRPIASSSASFLPDQRRALDRACRPGQQTAEVLLTSCV